MVPVRLDRLGIMVSGQHHPVPGRLKPQAQTAAAAEQVRRQMRALGPQAGRVGQELLLVRARLADERQGGRTGPGRA